MLLYLVDSRPCFSSSMTMCPPFHQWFGQEGRCAITSYLRKLNWPYIYPASSFASSSSHGLGAPVGSLATVQTVETSRSSEWLCIVEYHDRRQPRQGTRLYRSHLWANDLGRFEIVKDVMPVIEAKITGSATRTKTWTQLSLPFPQIELKSATTHHPVVGSRLIPKIFPLKQPALQNVPNCQEGGGLNEPPPGRHRHRHGNEDRGSQVREDVEAL